MRFSLPTFLNWDIYKKLEKIRIPFFCVLVIFGITMRALQYGRYNNQFDILYSLYGAFLCELVLFTVFFMVNGRSFSQLGRLQILYFAFVPTISYSYMKRIMDFKIAFELREDVVKGKWPAAFALWYPEISRILQLMVPFIILMVMAIQMNKDKIKRPYSKWFLGVGIGSAALALLTLPFANLTNIVLYAVRLGLVCVIWKMWECLRKNKSLEPMGIVSWAEIFLFFVLWLKGLVDVLEILT